jgi:3-hydroxyethyl bacteriochlorophyllide a dehydrogenase
MQTEAVVFEAPGRVALDRLDLTPPGPADCVVETLWSGISTGTEKLFYTGKMPPFPGMGYPLVPGYEAVGEVVEAGPESGRRVGERVFVPGATCYGEVRGLFGGSAGRLVVRGDRAQPVEAAVGPDAALLALAATARHALAAERSDMPDLIVGHGVLGRLLARITIALGAPAPAVWEINPDRAGGATGYEVLAPEGDPRRDYRAIYDVSGADGILDQLIPRLAPGGEIVLAGFYSAPVAFAFPPAFLKEARLRVAAEWRPDDLAATARLVSDGRLDLAGLITHRRPATESPEAYAQAFDDPACLKMILNWKEFS